MPEKVIEKRSCENCENQCLEPSDMNFYCSAVNQPWGAYLYKGRPEECGDLFKLWKEDSRRKRLHVVGQSTKD